jgi:V/A-type H+-transporting ATPase subunit I
MRKVRVIGRRAALDRVVEDLFRQRRIELRDARDEAPDLQPLEADAEREARRRERALLAARLEGLLALAPGGAGAPAPPGDPVEGAVDLPALRAQLDALAPDVERAAARVEALQAEESVLGRYVEPLRRLLPLVPELADLEEDELAALGLDTTAIVLATDDDGLVEALRRELQELLGERFELAAARVDQGAVGCVLIVAHRDAPLVQELLGREHVRHVALPDEYAGLSLAGAVRAMERRALALPDELARARDALARLAAPHVEDWRLQLAGLRAELAQLDAAALAAATERTAVLAGWLPAEQVGNLRAALEAATGGEVVVEERETERHDPSAPVLLRHSRAVAPYGTLLRFFDLPRPGTLDPSGLMALFLPLLFGAMVGDIGYGAGLAALAWWIRRRFAATSPVAADVGRVLYACAAWSVVFGALYGELLGNLGKNAVGDFALWFYRGDEDALTPLLLFAVAIGAAHIVLALLLGAWQAWQERHRGELAERLGTLLVLAGLFGVAGLAADLLPAGALAPAVAAVVVGVAAILPRYGRMGAIMVPIELIGVVGNVLSYLRVAAVGIASVYLAIVANEFAAQAPIVLGVVVAAFFHALNLALAAFSPFVQSLRLHYVEFFSKFLEGGGRPFRPFGAGEDEPLSTPTSP